MAVSQSLTLTESNVSTTENTSKVRILWKSTQSGESWNGYTRTAKYYVSINGGAETEYSVSYTLPQSSTVTIVDKTITITHKSDGSGTVKVRTWMDTDISAGVVEQTKSLTLETIPRASSLDSLSCASSYFNGTLTYKYSPKSSSFYNRCNIALNLDGEYTAVKSINLGQKGASSQTATVTLSESELSIIYNKLPNTASGVLRFTFRTYSDSGYATQIGDADYKEISLAIPKTDATRPTATVTFSPVSDFTADSAIYVKGLSKVKAVFSDVEGKYGATIAEYRLAVERTQIAGRSKTITSDYLTTSGSIWVYGYVTDSRGFTRTLSEKITVENYTTPTIDALICDTSYFNGDITYKYTPACSAFYSRCVISLGDTVIGTKSHGKQSDAQQTATVTLSASELSAIYNKLPSSTEGKLKFTFRAYSDSAYSYQVGEDSYREITLSIPNIDATQPTASLTLTPVSLLSAPLNTVYVKGKTKVTASVSGGEGKYGATISSYKVSIGGKTETPPYTSDYLINSGDVTITGTVTDSRGFSRTYTSTITVIDYAAPRILPLSGESEVIAVRCDSEGNLSDSGTYLIIKAKRDYSKVVYSGEQKNFCAIQYRYRANGGSFSDWSTILESTASSDEIVTGALPLSLDVASSYFIQVRAVDDVGEATSTSITISTEKVYWHRAGSRGSFAFGKYAEEDNTFDIAEDKIAIFRGEVRFPGEAWVELALGTNVVASTVNSGRWGGSGVFYRVCAGGKHIYVAFNVSFTTSGSTVRAESYTLPSAYRPTYDVYALCPVGFADGSRGIATVSVSPKGRVNIYAVHKLPGAVLSTGETVAWIDGYIDFWT